jgi:hypothetical protein
MDSRGGHLGTGDRDMSALLDLEQSLVDLKSMAGLLGHLSVTEREIDGEELAHIRTVLMNCHDVLRSWWITAIHQHDYNQHQAEVATLKAEIAALKLSHAPLGSVADGKQAEAAWGLLTSAAQVILNQAEEAGALNEWSRRSALGPTNGKRDMG